MAEVFDVVVVGAGPAGIAAAVTAAESKARVALLDERPQSGGQIWQVDRGTIHTAAVEWLERLQQARVRTLHATSVSDISVSDSAVTTLHTNRGPLQSHRVILACGARELFLPFPGWTLPGVTGAGALQALVHDGLAVEGQRIVVAGSGPLLLQVAAGLQAHGAQVVRVVEQTTRTRLLRFAFFLGAPRLHQALSLYNRRLRTSQWVAAAHGSERIAAVTVRGTQGDATIACDRLAVGFSLVPNLELAQRFGCAVTSAGVVVDDLQATSVRNVYAAGEICGIKGAPGALAEGICAGAAACDTPIPQQARRQRQRQKLFAKRLATAFTLRPELLELPEADTLVCRCEDVPYEELQPHSDWTTAKLQTRCGMGACQGRICGAATQHLFGWGPQAVRPPLIPVPIGELMTEGSAQ